jgi:hypothetical protein
LLTFDLFLCIHAFESSRQAFAQCIGLDNHGFHDAKLLGVAQQQGFLDEVLSWLLLNR